MNLHEDDFREFAQIWSEEFREALSIEEARYHASMLLELYSVLARSLPSEAPVARKSAAQHRT